VRADAGESSINRAHAVGIAAKQSDQAACSRKDNVCISE
jgi:hypothetical protein